MTFTGQFDTDKIEKEIEDFLFKRGFELIDMKLEQNHTRPKIELFVDKLGGVTVNDLSEINRRVQTFLEAGDFFPDTFQLLVSSPGLDRVIKREADFNRFAGRRVKFSRMASDGKHAKTKEAVLVGFEDDLVIFEMDDNTIERIPLDELKFVRLVPDIDFSIDAKVE